MRPLWSGSLSFGLINIPVRLFSATNPRQGIDLDMLHKTDHAPIRYARVCRQDGEEIPWDDIVKGYEYRDGDYVVLTQKDLDQLDAKRAPTIDIMQFVDVADVDIRYFERPYYLEAGKGGEKAYALLRQALQKSGKAALAKFVFHQRQHVGLIVPMGRALLLEQMWYPADLRETADLNLPAGQDITTKEAEMALKLVHRETKPFVPEDLLDNYTGELEEMIKAKTKAKQPGRAARPRSQTTSTRDLMAALKASLKE